MKRLAAALTLSACLTVALLWLTWGLAAKGVPMSVSETSAAEPTAPPAEMATPYPQVLARLPVTSSGAVLDFARDVTRDLLFASSVNETLVFDGNKLQEIARLPFGGNLLVDGSSGRLYVYPGSGYATDDSVQVINLNTLTVVGTITNVTYIDVDMNGGRVFAGNQWEPYAEGDRAPVRIYDADTVKETGRLTQTGIPVYNPVRGDLVVLHESATVYDLESFLPVGDLLAEFIDQDIPMCNGCEYVADGTVFSDTNLLVLQMQQSATGGGPGFSPLPRFYDAKTLAPLDGDEVGYQYRATCSSSPMLQAPIDGKYYRNSVYRRYVVIENLIVETSQGRQLDMRDGTYATFVNPTTRQAIVDQGYVVDLDTLAPIGRFPAFCWLDYDSNTGLIFGRDGGDLLVLREQGGSLPTAPAPIDKVTLTGTVASIVPSPDFAKDQTVFAFLAGQGVVRSTDGGVSWSRLRGGLPEPRGLLLDLAISPNFAADGTIFVGGVTDKYRGEGVLRSTDGGETWQPLWQEMAYLRVRDVAVGPDYALSGEVAAMAEYNRLEKWESGTAIYTSTNRGISWTLALTGTSSLTLPSLDEVVGSTQAMPDLPVRLARYGEGVSVTLDSGVTWQLADLGQADNDYFNYMRLAPDYPRDPAIYVMSRFGLWRTVDGGISWARWHDAQFDARDYTNELTAIASASGSDAAFHWLFLGTADGDIIVLQGERVSPVGGVPSFAQPAESEVVTPQPTATPMSVMPNMTPTAEPTPLAAGDPPEGLFYPQGTLTSRWESDLALQQAIGWATQDRPDSVRMARQDFTGGLMLWRQDTSEIYVIYNDGRWDVFDDTFIDGEAEYDPSITPPTGYQQPIRGFGKVWREEENVREEIGWATGKEQGFGGFIQPYERGILLTGGDRTLALIDANEERTWR